MNNTLLTATMTDKGDKGKGIAFADVQVPSGFESAVNHFNVMHAKSMLQTRKDVIVPGITGVCRDSDNRQPLDVVGPVLKRAGTNVRKRQRGRSSMIPTEISLPSPVITCSPELFEGAIIGGDVQSDKRPHIVPMRGDHDKTQDISVATGILPQSCRQP
ncbi:hypothetical protein REPUB_Repub03eG0253200 [Reevesia pubescens]